MGMGIYRGAGMGLPEGWGVYRGSLGGQRWRKLGHPTASAMAPATLVRHEIRVHLARHHRHWTDSPARSATAGNIGRHQHRQGGGTVRIVRQKVGHLPPDFFSALAANFRRFCLRVSRLRQVDQDGRHRIVPARQVHARR